jgi:hypothetical protein
MNYGFKFIILLFMYITSEVLMKIGKHLLYQMMNKEVGFIYFLREGWIYLLTPI